MPKTCVRCQSQAFDDAAFCPNCGQALVATAPAPTALPTHAPPTHPPPTHAPPTGGFTTPTATTAGGTPPYSFNAARWSVADRITGIATVVLFISVLLPWFSAGAYGYPPAASGVSAHGYLSIVLFVCVAIILYLGARAGWDRLPISAKVAHAPVMLLATALNLLLVFIGFLFKPGGVGVGWSIGAWLALIAAIVAVAPIAVPAIQARSGGR